MTAPDASERAQGWLVEVVAAERPTDWAQARDFSRLKEVFEAARDAEQNLARLGPPSVGLAVALREISGLAYECQAKTCKEEGRWHLKKAVDAALVKRCRIALAAWEKAVQDAGERGKVG